MRSGGPSGVFGSMPGMELAVDTLDPRRRIAFGTREALDAFLGRMPEWTRADPTDPEQPPVTGHWSAPTDLAR